MKKVTRKIIEIDEELCDGCGLCVPSCAEGAIQIVDGKARLVAEKYCDGLGACLGECPNGALRIVEREAEEFDEDAVAEHLQHAPPAEPKKAQEQALPCGCPSAHVRSFAPVPAPAARTGLRRAAPSPSALSHWPVQIRLVPPTAPFLRGADLLVLADCVAVAYPDLHRDLLPGKAVLVGCPKLDDAEAYVEKFTEIFQKAGLRSVTIAMMEVPCCHGLSVIVHKALKQAGVSLPVEEKIITVRGEQAETRRRPAAAR